MSLALPRGRDAQLLVLTNLVVLAPSLL